MKNTKNEINASSMADIAFLLLIFFLVTTTIDQDKGILNRLPADIEEVNTQALDKNVLEISLNSLGNVLVEGELSSVGALKELTRNHVLNKGVNPLLSDSPKDAIISLENDRGTSYDLYIQIQNELKLAFNEIRNEESLEMSGGQYSYLQLKACIENASRNSEKCKELRDKVKDSIPMAIIEKEYK